MTRAETIEHLRSVILSSNPESVLAALAEMKRLGLTLFVSDPETETERCPSCMGAGTWQSACCDGSGGCSCRGEILEMGTCNVCRGSGQLPKNGNYDRDANINTIRGLSYLGSGPSWGRRGL